MSGQKKKKTIIVVKWAGKLSILRALNPLTPNISLATLLTVCHTVLVMLVLRIWYWIS